MSNVLEFFDPTFRFISNERKKKKKKEKRRKEISKEALRVANANADRQGRSLLSQGFTDPLAGREASSQTLLG